ncbi:hypothetical protein D5S18_06710 [Nocardia panacis]|uniref:Uncharacterized protein n=1 Tax=Nocardia panacis TaxID=2340916 RepID=A0A3A4KSU5_9NOCA|nr:hypothetical protein [Nocardia panacis]RJO77960.1 hypothetical protein D5S18_06710 [Nocardia panacis]
MPPQPAHVRLCSACSPPVVVELPDHRALFGDRIAELKPAFDAGYDGYCPFHDFTEVALVLQDWGAVVLEARGWGVVVTAG